MPRRIRYQVTGVVQHVVQRGNNRQPVFFADEDYRFYLECLEDAARRYQCRIHAYALLPGHVHLLLTPSQPHSVSKLMQSVGRRYVRHINFRHLRTGTLWEGRYKASLVEPDCVLNCCHYIETSPVRAQLASKAGDYRWSSHAFHAQADENPVMQPHAAYLNLGANSIARAGAYLKLMQAPLSEQTLSEIRGAVMGNRAYGSKKFEQELEARLNRRVGAGRRGRPPKKLAAEMRSSDEPLAVAA